MTGFRAPAVTGARPGAWVLHAEPEVRLADCLLFGTSWVGFGTYMNRGTIRGYCDVGRYTSIGRDVTIGLAHHNLEHVSTSPFFGFSTPEVGARLASRSPVRRAVVGHDCWIGDGARIASGVRVGTGAIVGAGAVVTKDVADYQVVGGVPARHLRWRFDEPLRSRLLRSAWWELDPGWLRRSLSPDPAGALAVLETATDAPRLAACHVRVGPPAPRPDDRSG